MKNKQKFISIEKIEIIINSILKISDEDLDAIDSKIDEKSKQKRIRKWFFRELYPMYKAWFVSKKVEKIRITGLAE